MRALREAGIDPGDRRTECRQFRHSLMICEALASLDLAARSLPDLRLIGWPEILGRTPHVTRSSPAPLRIPVPSGGYLVPDGLFGIEYTSGSTKTYRFFALEADRGTMPVVRSNPKQTSYLGKLTAYREIIERQAHKAHWGIPNLLVLTLTNSKARMVEMMRHLAGQRGNSAAFLFKAVAGGELLRPMPALLTEPWERAGLPPLRISDSGAQPHQTA